MAPRAHPRLCTLLVLTLILAWASCQHYLLLRPVPSDHLPLVELKEDPDPSLDPRDNDLNETELRDALGGHFDAHFMSVHPPPERDEDADRHRGREEDDEDADSDPLARLLLPTGPMSKDFRLLDSEAHQGKKPKASKKLRRRLQMWLWAYAACPVLHAWSDLGVRFWPRYVKSGRCSSKRSCSVPEGMRCVPAKARRLTLLRWRCVRKKAALKCAWIPVQYPVVSECKCSCAK
ncbi:noggin-3 [Hippocampus zosterae]|uniref:noggin-3 n=1 Tax=Hippocampus zosterae TaxID=109293 RepID=UPI00223D137B|nr:noggin-3 [Hippocampus zosterae]